MIGEGADRPVVIVVSDRMGNGRWVWSSLRLRLGCAYRRRLRVEPRPSRSLAAVAHSGLIIAVAALIWR